MLGRSRIPSECLTLVLGQTILPSVRECEPKLRDRLPEFRSPTEPIEGMCALGTVVFREPIGEVVVLDQQPNPEGGLSVALVGCLKEPRDRCLPPGPRIVRSQNSLDAAISACECLCADVARVCCPAEPSLAFVRALEKKPQAQLAFSVILLRGPSIPGQGLKPVYGNATTDLMGPTELVLRRCVVPSCGRVKPACGLGRVGPYACSVTVDLTERISRGRVASSRALQELVHVRNVRRQAPALFAPGLGFSVREPEYAWPE